MENGDVTATSSSVQDLEALNEISEQMIREEYLAASLHGPHWVLGLDGKAI